MEQTASDRQPLRAPLDEFRTALDREITAAQANLSATAVALTDGKLVAPVGGAFHYTFDTLARVGVPPDTEGQLILPDRPDNPIDVRLVEIAELKVTLAVATHIGRAVPSARLQTDLTMLLKRLIARIEEKAQEGHSAADRVLGKRPPSGKPVTFTAIIPVLNKEQKQAVASALGRDTTFVWGPPGTGKTYTIGEIGAQLLHLGKTLLIASHTNTAVDGAVLKIAEACKGRFEEGDIVRVGDPVKSDLREMDRASDTKIIMRSIVEKRERLLKERRNEAQQELDATKKESGEMQRLLEIAEWLSDAPDDIAKLEDKAKRVSALVEDERTVSARLSALVAQESQMRQLAAEAAGLLVPGRALSDLRRSLNAACGARDRHCNEKLVAEKRLNEEMGRLRLSRSLEPIRERARKLPSPEVLQGMAQTAEKDCAGAARRIVSTNDELLRAEQLLDQVGKIGAIKRMWLKLPKPENQAAEVERLRLLANAAREEFGMCQ
ncbi:AAA domain-containing protein [uncultured Thiodictyon sp.]|uniref:AAA domain-containing protein n=1 Tax=uncultured Thiodictyon sp. TaxID=1846217 RepID=UPI0025D5018F|nr:AAA domain-containing protein [uncultured Thiodictyon sp.]